MIRLHVIITSMMKYVRQDSGQIRAMANFALHDGTMIVRGTLGGTVANYRNLAQGGKCWVFPGGSIDDDAFVSGNAVVLPGGEVLENANVYGNTVIILRLIPAFVNPHELKPHIAPGKLRVIGNRLMNNTVNINTRLHNCCLPKVTTEIVRPRIQSRTQSPSMLNHSAQPAVTTTQ